MKPPAPKPVATEPYKPQTFQRVSFSDGSFVRIVINLDPEPDESIIARIEWEHGSGMLPLEIIDALVGVWQWHSDMRWQAFNQCMTLPGGKVVCWRFRPQEPCTVLPASASSVIGEALHDAPPTEPLPETAEDFRDALRRAIPPETLAASLATLPSGAQTKIIGKHLIDPPIAHKVTFTRRRKS